MTAAASQRASVEIPRSRRRMLFCVVSIVTKHQTLHFATVYRLKLDSGPKDLTTGWVAGVRFPVGTRLTFSLHSLWVPRSVSRGVQRHAADGGRTSMSS